MCQAIEEGFAALRAKHIRGLPLDLAFLHLPLLRPVAVRYWSGVMRSNRGELYFAAHARSAPHEVGMLAAWILQQIEPKQTGVSHLRELLRPES